MQYAIETLEIELARLRQALRIAKTTVFSSNAGIFPNISEMETHIQELETAIRLLEVSQMRLPTPEAIEALHQTIKNITGETAI